MLLRDISYNDGDDDAHNDADGGDSDGDDDEDVTMSEITREIIEIEPHNEQIIPIYLDGNCLYCDQNIAHVYCTAVVCRWSKTV